MRSIDIKRDREKESVCVCVYSYQSQLDTKCAHLTFPWQRVYALGNTAKSKGKVHPTTGHEGPEREASSTLSLASALDGVSGLSHAHDALPPGKRRGTHRTGGWVGPRAGLDTGGKSVLYTIRCVGRGGGGGSDRQRSNIPDHCLEAIRNVAGTILPLHT
jgi:hypothetical protein